MFQFIIFSLILFWPWSFWSFPSFSLLWFFTTRKQSRILPLSFLLNWQCYTECLNCLVFMPSHWELCFLDVSEELWKRINWRFLPWCSYIRKDLRFVILILCLCGSAIISSAKKISIRLWDVLWMCWCKNHSSDKMQLYICTGSI